MAKDDPAIEAPEAEKKQAIEAQKQGLIQSDHFMAYLVLAFLASISSRDIGQKNKTTMEAMMTELWGLDVCVVAELFPGIYLEKVFDGDKIRVLLPLNHCPQRAVIVSSMKQLDFAHKLGRPSPGYMEQQLSRALQNL